MKRVILKPLNDRVLVRPAPREEKSSGGIIIPESAEKDKQQEIGEVIALGDGKVLEDGRSVPLKLAVGDHVLYGRYAGSDITINNEPLKIFREDEIVGTVEYVEMPEPVVES